MSASHTVLPHNLQDALVWRHLQLARDQHAAEAAAYGGVPGAGKHARSAVWPSHSGRTVGVKPW